MKTILVVEDEKNLRAFYEKELREEGYRVLLASDARAALALIRTDRPDLVVLDIRLPGMDGLEALGRILARDNSIRVILNSAYRGYRDSFLSWSADAFLTKTSDLSEMKQTVRDLIGAP